MLNKAPHGIDEVLNTFGDIRKYILDTGTISPNWEFQNIVRISLPAPLKLDLSVTDNDEPVVRRITCHRLVADNLTKVLKEVLDAGLWCDLGGYSGGYIFRPIRGSNKISMHSFGIAWDWGASRDLLGDTKIDMPKKIVDIFKANGFTWGGDFARKDAMHFQYASGV